MNEFKDQIKKEVNSFVKQMGMSLEYQMFLGADLSKEIIESVYVSDFDYVKRTWKERLFSLPFRPFHAKKVVHNPKLYVLKNGQIVCSPKTKSKILKDYNGQ